jgi:transcription elongation factor B subunit 1
MMEVDLPVGKVRLVSGDGFTFIVDEEAARVSATLRGMLDSEGDFQETKSRTIHLRDVSSRALERCCSYMYHKLQYSQTPSRSIPQFDVAPELALELLMASNYLDM